MLNFCWVSTFLDISFFNISWIREISRSPIKNTIFWKSMMRSFGCIEINCFNIFRFLAEVSTNLQKCTILDNLRTITWERKIESRQTTPFFHLPFVNSNCLWYSFLYLKIAKIHFHRVLLSSILVCKVLELGDVSCEIRILSRSVEETYTFRKVKIQVLLFISSWELNLSDLMVYICLFWNAIWHRIEVKVIKFSAHFSQNEIFIACIIFSLLLVICLSWNFHLKLSHEFLTFISFNIWR